jgi:Mrp family chromosome partitioning ATPase
VQRMVRERSVRVVQFSSPNDGDGATTTAVNLAVMLARSGTSVVVVDLDLRSPRVHTMLGLPRAPGVTEALADRRVGVDRLSAIERLGRMDRYEDLDPVAPAPVDLMEPDDFDDLMPQPLSIVTSRFEDDLAVLTAGSPPRSALEVLSRRGMDDLIARLRDSYELVILTSPATLSNGDASAIARHADGVVMVVKAGTCSLSVVRQALGTIDRAGSRILGVLLTGSKS